MRPLQLKLKGINSYREEQVIDFATLTSQGLFGIFGPTGSGKSSILDSITLALFARLSRGTRNFINLNEKTASVSFLFSITTDRTRKYLVERTFRSHGDGESATVRNTSGRLIAFKGKTQTVLSDKPTETTAECTRLLGLTSDDFMRTVVLPQGQFGEFLQLKGRERRGMLQRIFHLEKYGLELTGKISRAKQKQELLLSRLDGERKTYEDVTPENVAILEQQAEAAALALAEISGEKLRLADDFERADEILKLMQEAEPVKARLNASQEKLPEITAVEKRLQICERANRIRPFAEQLAAAKRALTQAETALQKAGEDAQKAAVSFDEQKKTQEKTRNLWEEKQPVFQEREQLLLNARRLSETLFNWAARRKEYLKEKTQVKTRLLSLQQQKETLLSEEETLRKKADSLEKELESETVSPARKKILEDGHVMEETYREKRANYAKNISPYRTAQEEFSREQALLKKQRKELSALQRRLTSRREAVRKTLAELRQALISTREERQSAKKAQQKWLAENMAGFIRANLKEGEPCPVCGSPFCASAHASQPSAKISPDSLPGSKSLAPANTFDEVPGKSFSPAGSELSSPEIRLAELEEKERNLQKQRLAMEKEDSLLETYADSLKELSGICGKEEENPCQTLKTASLPDSTSGEKSETSTVFTDGDLNASPDFSEIPSRISAFTRLQGQLQKQETALERQRAAFCEEHAALKKYLEQILALRREHEVENFSAALSVLQKKEEQKQQKENSLKGIRRKMEELTREKEKLADEISSLENKLASAQSSIESCEKIIEEQKKAFPPELSFDTDFSEALDLLKTERQSLQALVKKTQKDHEEAETLFQEKKEAFSSAKSRAGAAHTHVGQTAALLTEQRTLQGFLPDENLDDFYMEETALNEQKAQIEEYYSQLEAMKNRLAYLDGKRDGRQIEESEWLAKKEKLKKTVEKEKELQTSSVLLSHQLAEKKTQLKEKEKLEKTWERESQKKDRIKELEQLFKGNAFIEYVAQSRLSYIAREASAILMKISGGNYALEISDTSEFVIRDNRNGGVRRPTDTLSGGEIFITSLSLALALSSSIQLSGAAPLEFFFLDEGFGSLDDDLLDTVMTSLERLQSRKRSIGIISHVEAIQERVPVKLIVTPSDISQRGSRIQLEYS